MLLRWTEKDGTGSGTGSCTKATHLSLPWLKLPEILALLAKSPANNFKAVHSKKKKRFQGNFFSAVICPHSHNTVPSQHASVHGHFQVGNLKVKAASIACEFLLAFLPQESSLQTSARLQWGQTREELHPQGRQSPFSVDAWISHFLCLLCMRVIANTYE